MNLSGTNDAYFDVLILGAGVAGLSAAHALAHAGKRVALLEARDRVGGRIHSMHVDGCDLPVELGAEFIHGKPEELWQLISEAGVESFELGGDALCSSGDFLESCNRDDDGFSILDHLPEDRDWTFAEWMSQQHFSPDESQSVNFYVEGFNAADAKIIGTASLAMQQRAEESIGGDRLFRVREGYSAIAEYLLHEIQKAGGEVFLSTVVNCIQWNTGHVCVQARHATEKLVKFNAPQCVITLPLGVLQAGSVKFDPPPEKQTVAMTQLAMGSAKKVVLIFRRRFWEEHYSNASFLFPENDLPPLWWTLSPDATPMLTGWIGGPRTRAFPEQPEEIYRQCVVNLARLFTLPIEQIENDLLSWHMHDWEHDPFSRGAYSYVPKDGLPAVHTLAEPVNHTLFFAGEHTDLTGHWGTVHAAIRSGLRAAKQVLNPQ
jgi:monoamine oxidase